MSAPNLDTRLAALREVHTLGAGRVSDPQLSEIASLLARAEGRRALSAEHTVVGLFGATGSGKSSLLNALVGDDIALTNVRRPTTSEPLAVTWDPVGAVPLLDWLDVRNRHTKDVPIDPRATRLILLDLPDFDSVESEHRSTAERLAGQVDVLVWVVDPQKYADAVLHTDFVAQYARHGAVTIVALNQSDLLAPNELPRVVESLRGLLADDGLARVSVLTTSATTSQGIDQLRSAIGALAGEQAAQTARLTADVVAIGSRIPSSDYAKTSSTGEAKSDARKLIDRLGDAAGVDIVARAVAGSYRKRSGQATGWPVVSWILRLRADPLARLGLRPAKGARRDPELHRTSMPALGAAAQAKVSLAVRSFADDRAGSLAEAWREGVREVGRGALDALPAELDLAISRTNLPTRGSWWWVIFSILQWISIAVALAGVLWLLAIGLFPSIGLPPPPIPRVEGWPLTSLLIIAGVLLGILLGLAAAAIGAAAAARRRRVSRKALLAQVGAVAHERVISPIDGELDRARRFDAALSVTRV